MKITVERILLGELATIGELYIDGDLLCDTLEDKVRYGEKVYGKTAIPEGTYKVILSMSTRFKKILPEILNVPGFSGIRIHTGNKSQDTEGCILVGSWDGVSVDWISDSKKAMDKLMSVLQEAANRKEAITITIKNL